MLTPGTIVGGGGRIELLLDRGAMGEVYRAVQLALDRRWPLNPSPRMRC